jgi:hypothetical protein
MKHLKLFENFDKSYYEFDAIKFYNDFKKIFNSERDENIDNFRSTDFFKTLDNLLPTWSTMPLDKTIEQFVKDILQDKEVEFYDLGGDVNVGRVKNTQFYYSIFFTRFSYAIDLYEEPIPEFMNVDYSKSVKIYGEPTKIEKIVDLYIKRNKFNI